jgi:large subunit ribosomal protein LP0
MSLEKKKNYINQLQNLCEEYKKIIVVNADNVGSSQFAEVRKALRGRAIILMGKKTLMRKAINMYSDRNEQLKKILPFCRGNIGLVFTNDDLVEIKNIIVEHKVAAPAKQGSISPVRVIIPAQNTGMEPTKTSFFQALNIATKITRGSVEILHDHVLLEPGDKVGNSEATLLQMMNIKPFTYGLTITQIYDDGALYAPAVLDLTEDDLMKKFQNAVSNVAAVSLEVGYPTEASIPHSIANYFKNLLAVAVETEYTFKEAEEIKEAIKNPSKFAVAAPVQETKEEKQEEEVQQEESESDSEMGMDLFGDD